jgi:hypothetical protein
METPCPMLNAKVVNEDDEEEEEEEELKKT